MTEIAPALFLKMLSSYRSAVNWEDYQIYAAEGDRTRRKFYEDLGCVTVVSEYVWAGEKTVDIAVYELSTDADVGKVISYWTDKASEYEARGDSPMVKICANIAANGDMLADWSNMNAKLCFARSGDSFDTDPRIRPMTDSDNAALKFVCDMSLDDTNPDAVSLARHFSDMEVSDCDKMLGLFVWDELVGFVEYDYIEELDLAVLENVFVSKTHRGDGVGKALVKAAMSNHPDKKWAYGVWNRNARSMALATSLEFKLEGATILIK